jgi:predicted transcriptional regulator
MSKDKKLFPKEFLRIIELSKISKKNIAKECNINLKRFYNLIESNGSSKMDNQEFLSIRNFCIQKNPNQNLEGQSNET